MHHINEKALQQILPHSCNGYSFGQRFHMLFKSFNGLLFLEVNSIIFYYSSQSHKQQSLFNNNNNDNNKTRKRRDKIAYTITLAFILFSSTFLITAVSLTVNTASAQSAMAPPTPLVMAPPNSSKPPAVDIFNIPPGYKIEPVLLEPHPSWSVTFDDNGSMYITEAGYSYGGFKPIPRILKSDQKGHLSVLVDRGLNGPITDIEFNKHDGLLYVSHRGIISAVDGRGHVKDLIVGLPSMGNHHNNQIAFGSDGRLYFAKGR